MLRWKSSLKPAAAASGLQTPTLLGTRNPTNTGRSSTSINISSATQGALLLASVTARSIQENLSDPTEGGWTLLASVDNGSSSNRPLNRVYYKTAGSSESTVTWTHDSDYTTAVAIEIVGADTSTLAVTTNQSSPILGVVTVPTNGFVIAVHAKGDNSNTSSSQVRLDDGVTVQTQYTMLGDAYGTQRSGTFMAVGNVGAGNTNGTDKIVGAGDGSRSATHHIAIKPSGATAITLETSAENEGFSGYSSPHNISVSYPAVSENDIMLMILTTERRTNFNGTPPTGWTKVIEVDGSQNHHSTQGVFWKRADASATASTGNTWSSIMSGGQRYYVWVGAYSGCVTSGSPIDATASGLTNYNTSWSINITTVTNNAMILAVMCTDRNDRTFTWSDGTELVDTVYQSTATVTINEKIESTAGTHSRGGTFNANAGGTEMAVALKPA